MDHDFGLTKVLITGASGHIGRFLLARLTTRRDLEVWGTTRFKEKVLVFSKRFPQAKFLTIDLLDSKGVSLVLDVIRPDVIVHLAGESTPGAVKTDREKAWEANVAPAQNLLEAAKRLELRQTEIFLAGTALVYKGPRQKGFKGEIDERNETAGIDFEHGYLASKRAQEVLGDQYVREAGLKVIGLRFSQISGWGRPMGRAETDFARQMVLIKEGKLAPDKLTALGDVNGVIDLLSVKDAALAIELLMGKKRQTMEGIEIINVCSAESRRVWEIIEVMKQKYQLEKLKIFIRDEEAKLEEGKPSFIFSNAKLREILGEEWRLTSRFDDTVAEVLDYCRFLYEHYPGFLEGQKPIPPEASLPHFPEGAFARQPERKHG